jgi:hypothetical protein
MLRGTADSHNCDCFFFLLSLFSLFASRIRHAYASFVTFARCGWRDLGAPPNETVVKAQRRVEASENRALLIARFDLQHRKEITNRQDRAADNRLFVLASH